MEKFQVAAFREQGQDVVVVFVNSSFGNMSEQEQSDAELALQACAVSAGLPGTVVPIWKVGTGFRFRAPQQWHSFFKSQNLLPVLVANINGELTCDS